MGESSNDKVQRYKYNANIPVDQMKSFKLLFILCLILPQMQSCTSDKIQSLGDEYYYRDEGEDIKDILCENPNGGEVPATVVGYVYDNRFILAKQLPKIPQDILYDKQYIYKEGSGVVYFWIIDKARGVQYGPLCEREYYNLRVKLKIPTRLQIK